ncbi:MAG: hypothetical protein QOH91_2157 [Mycobacterium sp.]|jgi:MFS family permease|nr:hypothetical protein [Mycobacterium sp.]
MLAAYATVQSCGIPILLITHSREVHIGPHPTTSQWILLGILVGALPLATTVGWLVSRLPHRRVRGLVGIVATVVAAITGSFNAGTFQLPSVAIIVALVLILTGLGVGSVLGWAVKMMLSHLATVGALAVRALPVVLLTALVFFNTYVWLMAGEIKNDRLSLAILFLFSIAAAFVISTTVEKVRPMLQSSTVAPENSGMLADTPFATLPDAPYATGPGQPLKRTERLNVVFLLAASQLVEILVVASVTGAIYLILGLIVLTPELLKEWTHTDPGTLTVLGATFPAPGALIHMCLFLSALTFMYISARAVDDAEYRKMFLDPLIDDLRVALIARNRYRSNIAPAEEFDAT